MSLARTPNPRVRPLAAAGLALALASGLGGCSSSTTTPTSALATPPAASSTAATPSASPTPSSTPGPALKDLAGTRYFGTALSPQWVNRDTAYADVAASQFDQVTPENEMKWQVVEPQQGQFDWSGADAVVAFAQAHDQLVRGHTLVWHSQLPDWLANGSFTPAQLKDLLQQHIATEMGRYAGKIYAWDVVNEAFNEDGSWRDDIWYKALGEEYVADAFKWAHAADPAAKLYINDYNVEGINPKSDALYDLVKKLKTDGVPIDGVGIQGHFDLQNAFPSDMTENLQRFADLGLEVAITELDVRMTTPASAADLATQAAYYKQAVEACVSVTACVGITVWGFGDRYSWVPYSFPGEGAACLWDENLAPKPALAAVQEALQGK
jgi:endo-1,4-beta-xylanase